MKHPWLHKYPVRKNSEYLILGTHPPMPYCGRLEYYYGNMGEFWRILDEVYPGENLFINCGARCPEILAWQQKYRIAITDLVESTNGEPFSTDDQMQGIQLNKQLAAQLAQSKVHTIYFTSFGGTNSALSLFRRWLKENGHKNVQIPQIKEWLDHGRKIQLGEKEYTLHALYSPSPSANRAASRVQPYQKWKNEQKEGIPNSYFDFRVWWYAQRLPLKK